jgi:trigger factor
MTINVETLEKLQRKVVLQIPVAGIKQAVHARLNKLASRAKVDGFRPGKVPPQVVAQMYGSSVHYEVLNDQLGLAFAQAMEQAQLRVAGMPHIDEKNAEPNATHLLFDATFEVYPEITLPRWADLSLEKVTAELDSSATETTIDILRKQRRQFSQVKADTPAAQGYRATVDFEGKIDGEPFSGGQAQGFAFVLGEGRMLPEFEEAVTGMHVGESKTFPLTFPADYSAKELGGKTADFLVTLQKLEKGELPEVNDELARSLKAMDGTVTGLRTDIEKNLRRELNNHLFARNKTAVWEALLNHIHFDIPQALLKNELNTLTQEARANLKQRGVKDADQVPIPPDLFEAEAVRRVRLSLIVSSILDQEKLRPGTEDVRAHLETLAGPYDDPSAVMNWYQADRDRLAQVEGHLVEQRVVEFVLSKAQVQEKAISFEDAMGRTSSTTAKDSHHPSDHNNSSDLDSEKKESA